MNPLNVGRPSLLLVEFQAEDGEQNVTGMITTAGGILSASPVSNEPIILAALLTPARSRFCSS